MNYVSMLAEFDPQAAIRLGFAEARRSANRFIRMADDLRDLAFGHRLGQSIEAGDSLAVSMAIDAERGDNTATMLAAMKSGYGVPVSHEHAASLSDELVRNVKAMQGRRLRSVKPWRFRIDPLPTHATCFDGFNCREVAAAISKLWRDACPELRYTAAHCLPGHERRPGDTRVVIVQNRTGEVPTLDHYATLASDLSSRFEVSVVDLGCEWKESVDLGRGRELIERHEPDAVIFTSIGSAITTDTWLAHSRLAPVQISLPTIPMTSGMETVDYFISSEHFETEASEMHHTETVVGLSCLPTAMARRHVRHLTRSELGLPPGTLYVCAQQPGKLTPVMRDLIAGVLEADRAGRVVVFDYSSIGGYHLGLSRATLSLLRERLMANSERLVVLPFERDRGRFLSILAACDAGLDTPAYSGGTSTLDSITTSLPVVTMPGGAMRTRITAGVYAAMGFSDLIASSAAAYVELAVRLGTDPEFNRHCRAEIAERSGSIFGRSDFGDQLAEFMVSEVGASKCQSVQASN